MTIITKPLSEKKGDKLILPLVENEIPTAPSNEDVEARNPNIVLLRARARRISTVTTLCLLLTSFIVVGIGIACGKILYDQYISVQMHRLRPSSDDIQQSMLIENRDDLYNRLRGYAQVPLPNSDDNLYDDTDQNKAALKNFDNFMNNYFREDFEIDIDKNYEKIDVPDFRDGRSGRFIHDFNSNITGIIDITGNRCFVMPLNRGNVLPPKSLFDLVHKMWDGYYKVDTKVIRESMRVVTPPIKDLKEIGSYIAKECNNRPVYKLEKYVGGVVKRSTNNDVIFAQFSGKGIIEFEIVNDPE